MRHLPPLSSRTSAWLLGACSGLSSLAGTDRPVQIFDGCAWAAVAASQGRSIEAPSPTPPSPPSLPTQRAQGAPEGPRGGLPRRARPAAGTCLRACLLALLFSPPLPLRLRLPLCLLFRSRCPAPALPRHRTRWRTGSWSVWRTAGARSHARSCWEALACRWPARARCSHCQAPSLLLLLQLAGRTPGAHCRRPRCWQVLDRLAGGRAGVRHATYVDTSQRMLGRAAATGAAAAAAADGTREWPEARYLRWDASTERLPLEPADQFDGARGRCAGAAAGARATLCFSTQRGPACSRGLTPAALGQVRGAGRAAAAAPLRRRGPLPSALFPVLRAVVISCLGLHWANDVPVRPRCALCRDAPPCPRVHRRPAASLGRGASHSGCACGGGVARSAPHRTAPHRTAPHSSLPPV
jgi:hypothetical protein